VHAAWLLCDQARGLCARCVATTDCAMNQHCTAGECVANVCNAGQSTCKGNAIVTCNSTGDAYGPAQDCGRRAASPPRAALDAAVRRRWRSHGRRIRDRRGSPGRCGRLHGDAQQRLRRLAAVHRAEPDRRRRGQRVLQHRPTIFRLAELPYTKPAPPPNLPTRVTLRAAWSELYLHMHIHVEDPNILVDPTARSSGTVTMCSCSSQDRHLGGPILEQRPGAPRT